MSLNQLEAACAQQTARFLRGHDADASFGYELFRRALDLQNNRAWEAVWRVYGDMVAGWVQSHPAFHSSTEEAAYFANRAMERLWINVACKEGKFSNFTTLAAVLRFLKLCVHSAVIDDGPRRPPQAISLVKLDDEVGHDQFAVKLDLSPLNKGAFWQLIDGHLRSELERIVVLGYFFYGIKNRELYALYSDRFDSSKQIANMRLSVLRRLARLPQFEDTLGDLIDSAPTNSRFLDC